MAMQLVVIYYHHLDFFHNISPKAHDWGQNLNLHQLFCWHQSQIKIAATYFASLPVGDKKLSDVLLAFCEHIASVFYAAFIILLTLSACWKVFGYISGPRRLSSVKTIQIIIFQICMHKLQASDVESLMSVQQGYPRHRKLPVVGDLVGGGVTLGC